MTQEAEMFWALRGKNLKDVVNEGRKKKAIDCLFESVQNALEILGDGQETIGGGIRRASVTFHTHDRSAVIWIGDDVLFPEGTTVCLG